jgi:hypothetical protein
MNQMASFNKELEDVKAAVVGFSTKDATIPSYINSTRDEVYSLRK